ncbi:MAG: nicotinate-nucleotide adenylyltransferase [Thermodesulfobacteriota bacterium]|nr:nicotinate-nucleotide adenylyltransferase [Thermodesulfobacteriota bacterium]
MFGGTFNPPHVGHLRMAEETAQRHGLEKIVFVPSHIPPHKSLERIASADDRLEMTRIACRDNDLFEVSALEVEAGGPSYTVNTLECLAESMSQELFFIIGTDSLREIGTWKEYHRLFHVAHFLVITRPGVGFDVAWESTPQDLREMFGQDGGELLHLGGKRLVRSAVHGLNISATQIRELVKAQQSIRYLVTEPVRAYILERGLYIH